MVGKGWFTPELHRNAVRVPVRFLRIFLWCDFQPIPLNGLKSHLITQNVVHALLLKNVQHQIAWYYSTMQYGATKCTAFAMCLNAVQERHLSRHAFWCESALIQILWAGKSKSLYVQYFICVFCLYLEFSFNKSNTKYNICEAGCFPNV